MPIIRNPFRRAPDHIDENAHPTGTPGPLSRTSSEGKNSLDIKPVEYKLSGMCFDAYGNCRRC